TGSSTRCTTCAAPTITRRGGPTMWPPGFASDWRTRWQPCGLRGGAGAPAGLWARFFSNGPGNRFPRAAGGGGGAERRGARVAAPRGRPDLDARGARRGTRPRDAERGAVVVGVQHGRARDVPAARLRTARGDVRAGCALARGLLGARAVRAAREALRLDPQGVIEPRAVVLPRDGRRQLDQLLVVEV